MIIELSISNLNFERLGWENCVDNFLCVVSIDVNSYHCEETDQRLIKTTGYTLIIFFFAIHISMKYFLVATNFFFALVVIYTSVCSSINHIDIMKPAYLQNVYICVSKHPQFTMIYKVHHKMCTIHAQ